MTEIQECPICQGKVFSPFLTCLDHSISFEKFNLIKCAACDLIITSPRPDDTVMGNYYLSPSYTSHLNTAKSAFDKLYMLARSFTLKWKLSLVKYHTKSSKSVLDYGCGTGEFLKLSMLKGWEIEGVEPSLNARRQASGIIAKNISSSLDDIPETKTFDAITLWHVLEHVPDLDTTLQKLKNRLSHNGTIFIAVPNHTSWDGKNYKQSWAGYDVPRHLWHFSKKNMKMLLEKNGLVLEKIIPMKLDAFYISLLSEKYQTEKPFRLSTIIKGLLNGLRSNIHAGKSNEYSSLIYLVKK